MNDALKIVLVRICVNESLYHGGMSWGVEVEELVVSRYGGNVLHH